MKLIAKLQAFSESELADMISPTMMRQIKEKDEHPLLKAFVVAHEGEINAKQVGFGKRAFLFFRDAIMKIHDRIREGLSVFEQHAETNAHEGRRKVGEIVGKTIREIGGKMHSIAAVHVFPKYRDKPYDIASIEANVTMEEDNGDVRVTGVEEITGLALSNSAVEAPGFPGATLLGSMQAFATKGDGKMSDEITLKDIKEFFKENKTVPSDVFSENQLTGDRVVGAYKHDHVQRAERSAEKVIKGLEGENKTLREDKKNLSKANLMSGIPKMLDSVLSSMKLGEKQTAFVKEMAANFDTTSEKEEEIQKDLVTFVGEQVKGFGRFANVFDYKPDESEEQEESEGDADRSTVKGLPPGSEEKKETKEQDPADNDMIPAGLIPKKE